MDINGYTLKRTCFACPEQYDVYKDGKDVGYLRLRHGIFRADCGGDTVFQAQPTGDGIFDDYERDRYLRLAVTAIHEKLQGAA